MKPHDATFMQAALALARRGLGQTAPNPCVAALVVDEHQSPPVMLGRGVTAPSGRPHAEAIALQQAGEAARGATLYVTLEPCSKRSQTGHGPSCTDLTLAAGIARVVIAAPDPSIFADGAGIARLRAAGVEVIEGVCRAEAEALNIGHFTRLREGRPFTFLKMAKTPDGFAGTEDGKAIAITGEETRGYVHRERASADAIITGIGTVLADDPQLDCRLPGMAALSPLRVILDSEGRFPAHARMLETAARTPILVLTTKVEALRALLGSRVGVQVLAVPANAGGRLDLAAALAALGARGITRAMVEAGPCLANAFAAENLLDEVALLTGPEAAGKGQRAIGPDLAQWLGRATLVETRAIGADALQRYERT